MGISAWIEGDWLFIGRRYSVEHDAVLAAAAFGLPPQRLHIAQKDAACKACVTQR
jgi:hypothetical protein